jgi:CHASE2 domain-containing sensor protein
MKKSFWLDALIATSFTFILMWGILQITKLKVFNAFDSIGKALSDVELTDYVFSHMRPQPELDTNIVVVNIGLLSRRQIAQQIEIISQYKPKVIGIDAFFHCKGLPRDTFYCPPLRDPVGNAMLAQAIKNAGNVVVVSKLLQTTRLQGENVEDVFDSLEVVDSVYREVALAEGYASLETDAAFQEDVKTCRTFNPQMMLNGKRELAFSVQMAMLYDSTKANEFLARENFSEIINYRGNMADFYGQSNFKLAFYAIDVNQVFEGGFLPGMIKDKIVIFGFLGEEFGDDSWEDKFYTPLNLKMAGKANPDMFGPIIHANIISMILHKDYINKMENWQEVSLAILLCLLNVALFSLIHIKLPEWYDGITKLLQVIQLLLLTFLMVEVFDLYAFKLEITIALAAIALVGDAYEIYIGVVKNLVNRIRKRGFRGLFTKRKKKVLTS